MYFKRNKSGVTRIQRASYGPNWFDLAKEVKERDRYTCQHPGCTVREVPKEGVYLHVHHVRPLSRGGTNSKANLISLCETHHKRRHSHM